MRAIILDKETRCHSTRIELIYFDDDFRQLAQWVLAFRDWPLTTGIGGGGSTKWDHRGSETFCAPPPPLQNVDKMG